MKKVLKIGAYGQFVIAVVLFCATGFFAVQAYNVRCLEKRVSENLEIYAKSAKNISTVCVHTVNVTIEALNNIDNWADEHKLIKKFSKTVRKVQELARKQKEKMKEIDLNQISSNTTNAIENSRKYMESMPFSNTCVFTAIISLAMALIFIVNGILIIFLTPTVKTQQPQPQNVKPPVTPQQPTQAQGQPAPQAPETVPQEQAQTNQEPAKAEETKTEEAPKNIKPAETQTQEQPQTQEQTATPATVNEQGQTAKSNSEWYYGDTSQRVDASDKFDKMDKTEIALALRKKIPSGHYTVHGVNFERRSRVNAETGRREVVFTLKGKEGDAADVMVAIYHAMVKQKAKADKQAQKNEKKPQEPKQEPKQDPKQEPKAEGATRGTAENKRQNGTSTEADNVVGVKGSNIVQSIPVSELSIDPARFQFKSKANKTTGVK